jgi:hypothetical protein
MEDLKPNKIVNCTISFQVKILNIYHDAQLIEFEHVSSKEKGIMTFDTFKEIAQIKH